MRPLGSASRGAYDECMTTSELAQTIQDWLDVLHREIALVEAADVVSLGRLRSR